MSQMTTDDDWVDTQADMGPAATATTTTNGHDETTLDDALLARLFPAKSAAKRAAWLAALVDAEFETLAELGALPAEGWAELSALPLAVRTSLRAHSSASIHAAAKAAVAAEAVAKAATCSSTVGTAPAAPPRRPVTQVDIIVMDVSCSMRARSALDAEGWVDASDPTNRLDIDAGARSRSTREDVSKLLFHTLVDKTLVFELEHAVGLIAFGEAVTPIDVSDGGGSGGGGSCITRQYERFHDELGRLDASQGCTKLYDAVREAAELVDAHATALQLERAAGEPPPRKRVFVLTDGQDNASRTAPWELAQALQRRGVLLDAIPLAGANATLRGLCAASGGLCLDVQSQQQGIGLFEREATLHVACRPAPAAAPPRIGSDEDFRSLLAATEGGAPVVTVAAAACKTAKAPVMSLAQATAAAKRSASSGGGGRAGATSVAAARRALKEYAELCASPAEGWKVFVCADNNLSWKAVLTGLPEPYAGGAWLATVDFPSSYPFAPPRVRFQTPLYHCNVGDGRICLDVLADQWSPALTIKKVLLAVSELMRSPDAASPLDAFKGALYKDNRAQYLAEASRHTQEHASAPYEELAVQWELPRAGDE
jgi:ubiquitin-protein ligase